MNLLLVALCTMIDPRARAVDVSGGGVVQIQGGRAPRSPQSDPEASVQTTITPEVQLSFRNRARGGTFLFTYHPRVLWRWPNLAGLRRPLVLNQFDAIYGAQMDERWSLSGAANLAVGDIDYTAAQIVFGTMQGTLPQAEVSQYLTTAGNVTVVGRLNPRHEILLTPEITYRMPLGDEDTDPSGGTTTMFSLPRAFTSMMELGHSWAASWRDALTTRVTGGYVDFDDRGAQATGTAEVEWGRDIGPRLSSTVAVGMFVAEALRAATTGVPARSSIPVLPTAHLGITGRLYQRARLRLTGDISAGAQAYYDTVLGEVVPRAGGAVGLFAYVPPYWTVGLRSSFFTNATPEPRDFGDGTDVSLNTETVWMAQTPISYRINRRYQIEFGTMWSARAPHVRAPNFHFRQLETWVYFAVRFRLTTAHEEPNVPGSGGTTVSGGRLR